MKGLVNHPKAAGVLVLGLGCKNNNITAFQKVLGSWDDRRVKFLNTQEVEDEIAAGVALIDELKQYADTFSPTPLPLSKLVVGLKCGSSDGYSGITANPVVGAFSDRLIAYGGSCVLTEVPEMFGAEQLLMQRCESEELFDKTVKMVNNFQDYFRRHNQVIYENPSPGNKAGGITTLEEKSLGCVQKGDLAPVVDVLDYGDIVTKNGLSLLNGPGNDIVAVTNLTAAGAHLILFTTGRGTPVGAPVPTAKIATNHALAERLTDTVIAVASGEPTKNERNGYHEISIFKDGIVL